MSFEQRINVSQLPISPRCELFCGPEFSAHIWWKGPHILQSGSRDCRRLLHVVGFIGMFILQPAEVAGPVLIKWNKNKTNKTKKLKQNLLLWYGFGNEGVVWREAECECESELLMCGIWNKFQSDLCYMFANSWICIPKNIFEITNIENN